MENKIEAYLRNELSPMDQAAFEQDLAQNPALSKEVAFQKDLIQTIQLNRKAELKARLNNVQVPSVAAGRNYLNVAAILTGVLITSIGTYFIWNQNKTKESTVSQTKVESTVAAETTANNPSVTKATALTDAPKTTKNQESTSVSSTQTKTKTSSTSTTKNQATNTQMDASNLNEVDMVEEHNVDFSANEINVPTINDKDASKGKLVQNIEIKEIKDANLGYTYYNNQLYLYGDFGNNPYELVELNNKQKKHLYIAMNDHFYELIQGKSTFTKFVAIKDTALIQQLTILKNQR